MVVAHILVGLIGGLLAAAWVWFGAGEPLWFTIAAYVIAGNITCLVSAGLTLLTAHLRNERRDKARQAPHHEYRQPRAHRG